MDIVFDIDGTLANLEHRRHFVRIKPKNWPAFDRAAIHDTPYNDIIYLNQLLAADKNNSIIIASGRSDRLRAVTIEWLNLYNVIYDKLYMRADKDYRSDDIIKEEILEMMWRDGYDPQMVFDDRNRVVDMWRRNGIRCLQVAPGDF